MRTPYRPSEEIVGSLHYSSIKCKCPGVRTASLHDCYWSKMAQTSVTAHSKRDFHSNNHLNLRNLQYETVLDKASMSSANTAKCLILWVTPMKLDLVANLPDVVLVPRD